MADLWTEELVFELFHRPGGFAEVGYEVAIGKCRLRLQVHKASRASRIGG